MSKEYLKQRKYINNFRIMYTSTIHKPLKVRTLLYLILAVLTVEITFLVKNIGPSAYFSFLSRHSFYFFECNDFQAGYLINN